MAIANVPSSVTPKANKNQATNGKGAVIGSSETKSSTTAVAVSTVLPPSKADALTALVKSKMKPGLDETLQKELAELLNLIPELDGTYQERFIPLVEIAILSLFDETPNIALAQGVREDIERRIHRSPLITIIRGGGSPPTRVILGLGTILYFVIPLLVIALPSALAKVDLFSLPPILLVATAGAVGSVVSIMVRMQDFEPFKDTDPAILFFTGLFKPIVGTAFALFVFATLNSGLITIPVDAAKAPYLYTTLAFVSGFSERFAQDIATRAEGTIVAVQSPKP